MIESNFKKYSQLETLNVSRETFPALEEFRTLLISENRKINLIGKSTEKDSIKRHIIDSAQIIDIIDKNSRICIDLGSGSGLPGVVLAIILKKKGSKIKFYLYEKSLKKSNFLRKIVKHFNLNAEVRHKNIFEEKDLEADTVVARAFKPLTEILELIHNQAQNWKKFFVFLGKTGKNDLLQASKSWDIEYKQRVSVTSSDSIVLEINRLTKR